MKKRCKSFVDKLSHGLIISNGILSIKRIYVHNKSPSVEKTLGLFYFLTLRQELNL